MRALKPCGTLAAYRRHLRNDEDPCDPCLHANTEHGLRTKAQQRPAVPSRLVNVHTNEMDAALEARPPVITWEKDAHGIFHHTKIDDPHAEREASPNQRAAQLRFYAQRKTAS